MNKFPKILRGQYDDRGLVALIGALIGYLLIYSHIASFITSKVGISSTPIHLVVIGLGVVVISRIFDRRSLSASSIYIIAAAVALTFIMLSSLIFLDNSVFALIRDRLAWALMVFSGIVLISNIRQPNTFLILLRATVLFSAVIVLAEFFVGSSLPVEMTTVPGRAAGLFENPNNAALFLPMALPVVTIGLRPIYRIMWYGLLVTCVFLTFSRGGQALCGLAILMAEAFPVQRGGVTSARRLLVCLIVVALGIAAYWSISNLMVTYFGSDLNANTLSRMRFEADASSNARLHLLRQAWEGFSTSPIWGHGAGAGNRLPGGQSVHNIFGLFALEYGAIGVIWIGGFLAALWAIPRPFGIWATGLFIVAGMTTHNLMDGPAYALILATYAALPAIFMSPRGYGLAGSWISPRRRSVKRWPA